MECSDLLSHAGTTRETAAILGSTQSNNTSEILSGLTASNDTSGTLSTSTTMIMVNHKCWPYHYNFMYQRRISLISLMQSVK